MTEKMQYQRWLDFPLEDPALKEELLSIKDKDEEIFDRFYQELPLAPQDCAACWEQGPTG